MTKAWAKASGAPRSPGLFAGAAAVLHMLPVVGMGLLGGQGLGFWGLGFRV